MPLGSLRSPIIWIASFALFVCALEITFSGGIPRDQLEAVYWGREFVSVSDKHPTLSGWIHYGWLLLFGNSALSGHGIPVANVLVSLALYVALLRALEIPRRDVVVSLWAVAASLNLYLLVIKYNANSATLPFWLAGMLGLWLGHSKKSLLGWGLAGLAAGLAVLVKYHSFVWLGAAFLWLLSGREERHNWRTPGPWVALGIFAAIVGAHLWDMQRWGWPGLGYGAENLMEDASFAGHILYPLQYVLIQIIGASPGLIVLAVLLRKDLRKMSHADTKARFLLFFGVVFPLLPVLVSAVTAGQLGAIWGIGTALMTAPWLLHVTKTQRDLSQAAGRAGVATIVVLSILLIALQGKREPEYQIASVQSVLRQELSAEELASLDLVAGTTREAEGATWYLPSRPRMMPGRHFAARPWIVQGLPDDALALLEGEPAAFNFGPLSAELIRSFPVSLPAQTGYAFPARAYSANWSLVRLKRAY